MPDCKSTCQRSFFMVHFLSIWPTNPAYEPPLPTPTNQFLTVKSMKSPPQSILPTEIEFLSENKICWVEKRQVISIYAILHGHWTLGTWAEHPPTSVHTVPLHIRKVKPTTRLPHESNVIPCSEHNWYLWVREWQKMSKKLQFFLGGQTLSHVWQAACLSLSHCDCDCHYIRIIFIIHIAIISSLWLCHFTFWLCQV